jgi:hypothetical protein
LRATDENVNDENGNVRLCHEEESDVE